jgi:hypothetical protein
MVGIIRGDAYLDSVSDDHLDLVLLHSTRKHAGNLDALLTLDLHCAAPQHPGDHALKMYEIVSAQFLLFFLLTRLCHTDLTPLSTKHPSCQPVRCHISPTHTAPFPPDHPTPDTKTGGLFPYFDEQPTLVYK